MRLRVFVAAALVALVGALTFATAATAQTRTFVMFMTGEQEAPGPGDPDGFGVASIFIDTDTNTVCWVLIARKIQLPAIGAHIHIAPRGVPGPIVVPLSNPNEFGFAFGCRTDTDADAIVANPSGYYVNVHTVPFPAGAIRGQLG
jgi:hypothetical protein